MKKFFATLAASLLISVSLIWGGALIAKADGEACETDGCTGTYTNGFCSVDETHYQPAKPVSDTHHSELNSTHNGYYAIENAGQLYWFAQNIDEGTIGTSTQTGNTYNKYQYTVANAVLTNDITDNKNVLDANGEPNEGTFRTWNPIGGYASSTYLSFSGIFDGNNKTVSGLYIDKYATTSSADRKYIGFVGKMDRKSTSDLLPVAKNITVKDSYFSGYEFVGGIAGSSSGALENCKSYATVKGHQNVGGVTGGVNGSSSSAVNSFNYGLVKGSNQTGGFAGNITYSTNVNKCGNYGKVCWISGSNGYMGGFAATIGYNAALSNCFNAGDVSYSASNMYTNYIGGFGSNLSSGVALTNCYSTGSVTTNTYSGDSYLVGGFAGSCYATLTNCYYNTENVTEGGEIVTAAFGKGSESVPVAVTTADFESGKVAYLLNGDQTSIVFKQTLGDDDTPNFTGMQVYYDETSGIYYNLNGYAIYKDGTDGLKATATVVVPVAGTYTLIFVDYEDNALNNIDNVTYSFNVGVNTVSTEKDFTLGTNDKIILWSNTTGIMPLCNAYTVE